MTAGIPRDEVSSQRRAEKHLPSVELFAARVAAVFDASDASLSGEEGGEESLRQTLIEVAAVAENLAAQLPPPDQWREAHRHQRIARLARRRRETPPPPPPKVCSRCGKEKSGEEFGRNAANPDGRMYSCRSCQSDHAPTPSASAA